MQHPHVTVKNDNFIYRKRARKRERELLKKKKSDEVAAFPERSKVTFPSRYLNKSRRKEDLTCASRKSFKLLFRKKLREIVRHRSLQRAVINPPGRNVKFDRLMDDGRRFPANCLGFRGKERVEDCRTLKVGRTHLSAIVVSAALFG